MIQDAMTICGILRLKIPRKASNRAIMDAVRFWLEEKGENNITHSDRLVRYYHLFHPLT